MRRDLDSDSLRPWWPAAAFAVGLGLAAIVAISSGMKSADTAKLLVESAAGSAAAALLALLLLAVARRTRLSVQASVAALAPVVAVAIGVTLATSAMFITGHDLRVLWVVLLSAGGVGIATSLILGARVARASHSVREMARSLGESGPVEVEGPRRAGPGELAALAEELRRTSRQLAEARERAEVEEKTRRDLVAWVSHDLRTPLAGIRAMVEALEDGVVAEPDDVARYHRTMRLETDRLARLVNDLFELSRIQSGSMTLNTSPVSVDELLGDAVAGATAAARAKQIELTLSGDSGGPTVKVSTPEMIRVLRNLLDNAIRHTDPGGRVAVRCAVHADGSQVQVSVLDECGGIPPFALDRLFETGYQQDLARSPEEGRGGLGLAIARGLVLAHEGDIAVRNETDGCCFTVSLPIHAG